MTIIGKVKRAYSFLWGLFFYYINSTPFEGKPKHISMAIDGTLWISQNPDDPNAIRYHIKRDGTIIEILGDKDNENNA